MGTEKGSMVCWDILVSGLILAGVCFPPAVQGSVARPSDSMGEPRRVAPGQILGTVRINGWDGDAFGIKVFAIPGDLASPRGTELAPGARPKRRSAVLRSTAEENVFTFKLRGLKRYRPYRLGVEYPPNPVQPKVFWRGPMGGIALSGGPAVAMELFVARTELEIRDAHGNWVGADELRFEDPESASRILRWKSSISGIVGAELQVSTRAFPTRGDFGPCDEPEEGIIYREQLQLRGAEWQEIGPLDFGQILLPERTSPPREGSLLGSTPSLDVTGAAQASNVSSVTERDLHMLWMGAPLYIRVVPLTQRGPACEARKDGVHGWVILARPPKADQHDTEPEPSPHIEPWAQNYTPPVLQKLGDGQIHPTMKGDSAYYVTKEHKLPPCRTWEYGHGKGLCSFLKWPGVSWKYNELTKQWQIVSQYDALGQVMVDGLTWVQPSQVLHRGDVFAFQWHYSSGSCSGWCMVGEVFGGLVTATYNGLGDFATYWANAFESIKDGVAEVVADVVTFLPVIGDACNLVTSCKNVIKFGIETGLASMGLPPSLPNWNELKQQGIDYLAAEIATEMASATGLPEEVTQLAADQAMDLAKEMAQKTLDAMTENQGSKNPGYDWVLPYMGMDPGVWTIWIKKREGIHLMSNLYLKTRGFAIFFDLSTNPNPFIEDLYVPGQIHVPTEFPASNIIMLPVVLQPDLSHIPPPKCLQSPGYSVSCTPNPNVFDIPLCLTSDGYNPFKPIKCSLWSNYIGVYYRDHWIEHRFQTYHQNCFYLNAKAGTVSTQDLIKQLIDPLLDPWLPYYPPFHDLAAIKADQGAFWTEPFHVGPGCE